MPDLTPDEAAAQLTPEERAHALFPVVLSPRTGEWEARRPSVSDIAAAIRSAADAATLAATKRAAEQCDRRAAMWQAEHALRKDNTSLCYAVACTACAAAIRGTP